MMECNSGVKKSLHPLPFSDIMAMLKFKFSNLLERSRKYKGHTWQIKLTIHVKVIIRKKKKILPSGKACLASKGGHCLHFFFSSSCRFLIKL